MNQRSRTKTLHINERKWVLSLFAVLLGVVSLYMYFVTSSVVQVVMRQESEREMTELSAHISALEAKYMEAEHVISADIATHDGYVEIEEKIFITKAPTTLVLSRSDGE